MSEESIVSIIIAVIGSGILGKILDKWSKKRENRLKAEEKQRQKEAQDAKVLNDSWREDFNAFRQTYREDREEMIQRIKQLEDEKNELKNRIKALEKERDEALEEAEDAVKEAEEAQKLNSQYERRIKDLEEKVRRLEEQLEEERGDNYRGIN